MTQNASRERLYLFDTTLRDGAQTAGIEFSLEDKISVIALLERLGVDYIEGAIRAPTSLTTSSSPKAAPAAPPSPPSA